MLSTEVSKTPIKGRLLVPRLGPGKAKETKRLNPHLEPRVPRDLKVTLKVRPAGALRAGTAKAPLPTKVFATLSRKARAPEATLVSTPTRKNAGGPLRPGPTLLVPKIRRCVPFMPLAPASSEKTASTSTLALLEAHLPKHLEKEREHMAREKAPKAINLPWPLLQFLYCAVLLPHVDPVASPLRPRLPHFPLLIAAPG
jgi:hypothetical protein